VDTFHKAVERAAQNTELILGFDRQAARQVAFSFGNVLHGAGHDVQGLHQQADQQAEQGDDRHHGNHRGDNRRGAEFAECGESLFLVNRQADIPVGRTQPFDRGKGHNPGFAVDLDLAQVGSDRRGVLRVDIFQVFGHQTFVRVYQDFAIGIDQKGVTHAVEIQCVDTVGDGLQGHVGTDYAQGLPGFFHWRADGDDHLPGGGIDIRLGQAR